MKTFSVMLSFYFLIVSVTLNGFFGVQTQIVNVKNTPDQSALMQAGLDIGNSASENRTNTGNNPLAEEEEEVKSSAQDDFFTLNKRNTKVADEKYLQCFHGINLTGEFISEIVPPPPKA